jgi:MFS family permease
MLVRLRQRRGAPAARLAARLYAYTFTQELILLYPFYAILFADSGLSTAQISTLFIIWSLSGLVFEIPSGVLADAVSRRLLLTAAPVLNAAAFGLWVAAPSYPVFALGFVLWGASGALQSGALEALVYEELDRHGAAPRYAKVIGRAYAASTIALVLAMALAGPVFAAGGYQAVGVASVVACLVSAGVAVGFPEQRTAGDPDLPGGVRAFGHVLRAGVAEVRTSRRVWTAAVFLVVISAMWGALDEYVALLAADTGVATERLPLLILVVYGGVAAGGMLGGVARRIGRRVSAGLLALAAVALAAGALVGHPAGFGLIGLAFCVFQLTEIAADARLQDAIEGSSRSTVTSLAGFGTELATIGVFAVYAVGSTVAGHAVLFAAWAAVYALVALVMAGGLRRFATHPAPDPS